MSDGKKGQPAGGGSVDETRAAELKVQVQELRVTIAKKALDLVNLIMPAKVLQLSDLYKGAHALNIPLKEVGAVFEVKEDEGEEGDAKSKKRKINDSSSSAPSHPVIPTNKVILEMLGLLKKEVLELIETINTVKIWIQLNIPKIEDGNNFGVSIQEETVSELGRAEDSGFSVLENMTKYFVTRAKLVSKIIKYPGVEDYRQSVIELDEKEFVNLKLCCLDLRNNYAILYDMITKNLEKIRTPRSANHSAVMF